MSDSLITRRSMLRGVAVTVVAGVAGYLVANNSSVAKRKNGTSYANAYGPSATSGRLLTELSRVPLGGGIILGSAQVVLTRTQAGQLHGFSAICTHQGCTVGAVQNGEIICPCHGSRFNAFTGAVINGPATTPLPPVSVTVEGGGVYTA